MKTFTEAQRAINPYKILLKKSSLGPSVDPYVSLNRGTTLTQRTARNTF